MGDEQKQVGIPLWALSVPHLRDAIVALIRHGVDHRKLYPLIIKRKRGRKRKSAIAKERKEVGRPRTWNEFDYRFLWAKYEKGAQLLRQRRQRVGYKSALEAICVDEGLSPLRARRLATEFYKRLSDAKKFIQKSL